MTYAEASQQAYRELTKDGGQPTDEELVARTRAIMGEARQSRTEGAPSADMPVDEDLTPKGYTNDLRDRTRQLEEGGQSNPLPMTEEYMLDGDILQYRPGMTQEEYDAAKANQRHRVGMIRGMGGDGGFGAQVHSQQVMDLGTAEQQREWRDWVAEDPARMQRYDPAAFQAWLTAKRNREAQSHAQGLREKWGDPAAAAYLESQRTGAPMDMSLIRTSAEEKRIKDRRRTERAAREEGAYGPAREELAQQDSRVGYRGAMGGADASRRYASGPVDADGNPVNPDGTQRMPETMSQRFSRRTAERKQTLDDRLKAYSGRNMLAGNDPRQNLVNAYNTLSPEMQQQAMLGMMFPDGATPLDVQQARAMAEARLNVADALTPDPLQDELRRQQLDQQNPQAAGVRHISEGNYESPEAQAEFARLAESFDMDMFGMSYEQRDAMAQKLQDPPYNMDPGPAEEAAYRYTRGRMYMPGEAPGQPGYVPAGSGLDVPPGGPQRPPNGWR